MKNKKFVSIASSLGLTVSLLTGCGTDTPENHDKDKDSLNQNSSGGGAGTGAIIGGNNSQSSKGVVGGSKGIGGGKGGATS